ncbi:hypothetical protein D3C76_1129770 [compost metagenome]
MADDRQRLARRIMAFYQLLRAGDQANRVGVLHAAGQHQGVVQVKLRAVEGSVHIEFVGGFVMVPATYAAFLVAQDIHHCATVFQRFTRAGQFYLLEAIGDQKGHALAVQLCTHHVFPLTDRPSIGACEQRAKFLLDARRLVLPWVGPWARR